MNQAVTRTSEAWIKVLPKALASIVFSRKMTGKELRSLRESLGLSQREFAEILGVTRVTITRAERDKPSRMVQSYIDVAFRDGKLAFSLAEPVAEYAKRPSKKSPKKRS